MIAYDTDAILFAAALGGVDASASKAQRILRRIHRGPPIKSCMCGNAFSAYTWKLLPRVGYHKDWAEKLELRNCPCGSTIAIVKRHYMSDPDVHTLACRALYGGRKARSARRKLTRMGYGAVTRTTTNFGPGYCVEVLR